MELDFSTLLAIIVPLLLALLLLRQLFLRGAKTTSPPVAGGARPVTGHLHLFGGSKLPHVTLGEMADKYGPIFMIKLGVRRALVVSSWEVAKDLFTTHDAAVSSRVKTLAIEHFSYNHAMFGFAPYGSYWRNMRKLISTELLSPRRLESLQHIHISEVGIFIKENFKLWDEKNKSSRGPVLVEMKQRFADLSLNVILRMVAGKRYFGRIDEKDEKEARHCQKVLRAYFHLLGTFTAADTLPFLRWFDIGGYEKQMKETAVEMDNFAQGWLDEHRGRRESGEANGEQDFMDMMLSHVQDADLGGYDADTVTKATCIYLIAGGAHSTTIPMMWALSLLLNHPHAMKKAQEELDTAVGKDRRVSESDIPNLPYLQAIVKESMRLYPNGPLGGLREVNEDFVIGGYHVPKGTRLMINMWKLQRDPNVWDHPSEFRPERFLEDHKDIDFKGQQFKLIPFGAGRRACPAKPFGLQVVHSVLANLLQAFDLSTPSNKPVDMTENFALTNIKVTPLDVLMSPRLASSLYY